MTSIGSCVLKRPHRWSPTVRRADSAGATAAPLICFGATSVQAITLVFVILGNNRLTPKAFFAKYYTNV